MKSPLRLVLPLVTLAGGVAAGHWLWPSSPPPTGTGAPEERTLPATGAAVASTFAATVTGQPAAWDGTVAGLMMYRFVERPVLRFFNGLFGADRPAKAAEVPAE